MTIVRKTLIAAGIAAALFLVFRPDQPSDTSFQRCVRQQTRFDADHGANTSTNTPTPFQRCR